MLAQFAEPSAILIIILAFLGGGLVKGLSGIGMPLAALPILSFGFSVPQSVALISIPIIVTNIRQALKNGGAWNVVKRFWRLQIVVAITLAFSSRWMVTLDETLLLLTAGGALVISVFFMSIGGKYQLPARHERWVSIFVGVAAGVLGGVSSLFGMPVVLFLASLKVSKDEFITAIAVIYLFAAVPYAVGLVYHGAMLPADVVASSLSVIPALLGLEVGRRLIRNVNDVVFRRILLSILFLMGISMILRGI
ncbi:MAG: sulfite exporter TauE/SafE family protein [Marinosulfonomonas sp.]|nr:sulfite exporter TauE/SafE family protein [Marinosulfonomonas sp.]